MSALKRAAHWGFPLGAAVAALDIAGALIADWALFDPTGSGALLLVIAFVIESAIVAVGLTLLFALWPQRWRIPRPRLLIQVGLVLVLLAAVQRAPPSSAPVTPSAGTGGPPVLWVVADTLRADRLYGERMGFPIAPNLRELAGQSLLFNDAEAASGWTIPSMATLMTGIHPTALDADRKRLPRWATTAAEYFTSAGYATAAVVDNPVLSPGSGFAAGFGHYERRSALTFAFHLPGIRLIPHRLRVELRAALPVAYSGCESVTQRAVTLIESERERPLFLYIHYMDPHQPYYSEPSVPGPPFDHHAVANPSQRVREGGPDALSPDQIAWQIRGYDDEIRALDRCFGLLWQTWRARYGDETLIVFTSDHGEEFLEHSEWGHGNSVYTELVTVPLLVRPPASSGLEARRIDTPIGAVDVLPTALEAVGLTAHPDAQGVSWLPYLRGKAQAPARPLYASQFSRGRRLYRWREADWVIIDQDRAPDGESLRHELFDSASHHGEAEDVGAENPTRRAQMTARLHAFVATQRGESTPRAADPTDERALKALGYIR